MKKRILLSVLLVTPFFMEAQVIKFEQVSPEVAAPQNSTPFVGENYSSIAFADIDNDGDQDVLVTGQNNSSTPTSELYTNDGSGNYVLVSGTPFTGVEFGSIAFADIDNDGDQDVLITGTNAPNAQISELYTNDGSGNFSLVAGTPFVSVHYSSIAFADIDNDGDQDVLITGNFSNASADLISNLYTNDGLGNFSLVSGTPFTPVLEGFVSFADIDNDGDQDVLITGEIDGANNSISNLYINDGLGNFSLVSGTSITSVFASSTAFTDVDGDNDQDLLITGYNKYIGPVSELYTNDGVGNFILVSGTPFSPIAYSSVAFADIDNDIDQDILITGQNSSGTPVSELYTNDGTGSYTLVTGMPFTGVESCSIAIADIDGDNNQDILITGANTSYTPTSKLYRNITIFDKTISANQSMGCDSLTTTIDINNSQLEVNYYLRDNATDSIIDGPIAGTGTNISLNTNEIYTNTTYNIYATGGSSDNHSLIFNGNGTHKYVNLGTNLNNTIAGTSNLTVEAWVNMSTSIGLQTVVGNYQGGMQFLLRMNAGKVEFYVSTGMETTFANATSTTTIPTGTWAHLAGTFDGDTIRIYVNGILENSVLRTGTIPTTSNNLKIGGGLTNNTEYFYGNIADVSIWSNTRTANQISNDKNYCLSGMEANLIALYNMTDGTGSSILTDATVNANNGTLVNMNTATDWGIGAPSITCYSNSLQLSNLVTLNVNHPTTSTSTEVACNSYISPSGNYTWTASGTYYDTIPNLAGCDSLMTFNLTINTVDNSVTQNGVTLSANATGATYKWLDCNNAYAAISGATSQTYIASANGSYAVEVTSNGCVDTSACYSVTTVGIEAYTQSSYKLYPNPVNNQLTIESQGEVNEIEIYNLTGQLLQTENPKSSIIKINFSTYQQGVYLIKVYTVDGQVATSRVVKE